MDITDALLEARNLIADPAHWTRCSLERDNHLRHCAYGALMHVAGTCQGELRKITINNHTKACSFLNRASFKLYKNSTMSVNDDIGHDAIMEVYDLAIRLSKDEE